MIQRVCKTCLSGPYSHDRSVCVRIGELRSRIADLEQLLLVAKDWIENPPQNGMMRAARNGFVERINREIGGNQEE